ncbi:MAG: hypothetical protein L0322_25040 [Chloroflexi bacterium]|nr:hypothetical protein [Chloroflexota bacterium]MCI0576944.1 hypothetical protein [Chloroflexota bacterium]
MQNEGHGDARRGGRALQLGWTRSSTVLLSAFFLTIFLLGYVWWPLAAEYLAQIDSNRPLWQQLDWLLLGIFAAMSLLIVAGADLKTDALVILVGLAGGLAIESWGTQTQLWVYYTQERPPLWIIPAWPIASLSIDRLVRLVDRLIPAGPRFFTGLYWLLLPAFLALMLAFTWPALDKSFTLLALASCVLLTLTPTNHRLAVLTFVAGSGLGYFLEVWGTTRLCWTYYTQETPPLFAVLAHGMAAVAFWRAGLILLRVANKPARTQIGAGRR